MNSLCKRCSWYYEDPKHFNDSDYVICDECGRLLTSPGRSADVFHSVKKIPKILWVGEDTTCIRDVRRAVYDPRKVVTTCEGMDVIYSHKCGGHNLVSENGYVAEEFIITKDKLKDKDIYSIISDEMPTIAIVVLDCMRDTDIADYAVFIKNYRQLMDIISRYKRSIVVVLNNVDCVVYPEIKIPSHYPKEKIEKIEHVVARYRNLFIDNGVNLEEMIPIATYIKWGIKNEEKEMNTAFDLEILVDGRYSIDRLKSVIDCSVLNNGSFRLLKEDIC